MSLNFFNRLFDKKKRTSSTRLFIIVVCFLFLFSLTVLAQNTDEEILSAKSAELEIELSSSLNVIPQSSNYVLSYIDSMIYLYPKDSYHQIVSDFETNPEEYELVNNSIKFRWDEPQEKKIPYRISAKIQTDGNHIPVKRKIDFPLRLGELDEEIISYVDPTEHIDSNDKDIINLADDLSQGSDDMYEVVLNIAKWVHKNINYNLSSITADVSQKASWVLENRQGVCDEMTSLFIALLRANDIPARYVSGISYTNSELFSEVWGPHGWAEVYFPSYGWVPFDVTYAEYGYIDPSHIELRKTKDPGQSSSFYRSYGNNVRIQASEFDINPSIISMQGSYLDDPNIDIVAHAYADVVRFGSNNAIEVTIKNNRNYYLPYAIFLSETEGITLHEKNPQLLLLKPGETKRLIWRVSVDDNLAKGFVYTFPIKVYSSRNEFSKFSFKAKSNEISYSEYDIEKMIEVKNEEFSKIYSNLVTFTCDQGKQFYYHDENPEIVCDIVNSGDEVLKSVNVCIHESSILDTCKKVDVEPMTTNTVKIRIQNVDIGKKQLQLSAKNSEISKFDSVDYIVLEYPSVKIKDVSVPSSVKYGEEYQFKFTVDGKNTPKDLKINVHINSLSKTWRLDQLIKQREFVISMDSKDLLPRNNILTLKVIYDDDNDKSYNLKKEYNIKLTEIPFIQKLIIYPKMWINDLLVK